MKKTTKTSRKGTGSQSQTRKPKQSTPAIDLDQVEELYGIALKLDGFVQSDEDHPDNEELQVWLNQLESEMNIPENTMGGAELLEHAEKLLTEAGRL